jgi:hypothetical protein
MKNELNSLEMSLFLKINLIVYYNEVKTVLKTLKTRFLAFLEEIDERRIL